jgi:hypothetical protein
MDYRNYFENPEHLNIDVLDDDNLVAHGDAKYADGILTLTFVGVQLLYRKRGIAAELLTRLINEGRRCGAIRVVGEKIRSGSSLRQIERLLGKGTIHGDGDPTKLPEQPERFIFAPSLELLDVESSYELTAEWSLAR